MNKRLFTTQEIGKLNELVYLAQKRLDNPTPHDIDITRGILSEIEKKLTADQVEPKETLLVMNCGECGKALHVAFLDGIYLVEPCPDCLAAEGGNAIEEANADQKMEKTYQSLRTEEIKALSRVS